MRLSNQALIVRGAQRSVVLNFNPERCAEMQRIPSDVADLLEGDPAPTSETQKRWLAFCRAAGFAADSTPMFWQSFRADWSYPFNKPVSSISFDIGASLPAPQLLPWVRNRVHRVTHLVFMVEREVSANVVGALCGLVKETQVDSFELMVQTPASGRHSFESIVFDRAGQALARRAHTPTENSAVVIDQLEPSLQQFLLQKRHAETIGQIHIDAQLNIWPHHHEQHHCLGSVHTRSLDEVLRSAPWLALVGSSKDQRRKCRDCELRYACQLNYTQRSDPGDLASAPQDCAYDPYSADWQKALFKPTASVAATA